MRERVDFYAFQRDLDFIKGQLARQPDRAFLARMGLIGCVWMLLAVVAVMLAGKG